MTTLHDLRVRYDCADHEELPIYVPPRPSSGLVLVAGTSGSGKSTILRRWFPAAVAHAYVPGKCLLESFDTIDAGVEMLNAFGLRTVPAWFRERNTLSTGEGHRADCALAVHRGEQCIDEFTSTVDRDTAHALSVALRRYSKDRLLVVATCHGDVEDWLQPDVVYDTDLRMFRQRRSVQRPKLHIDIVASTFQDWVYFSKYHYLTSEMSKAVHCYTAYHGGRRVAFYSVIHGCNRDIHSFWRGSRLVVAPEFQGLGIATRMSDAIASFYVEKGLRFFEKTANAVMGEYRNRHPAWRGTSTNMMARPSYLTASGEARKQLSFGKTEATILRDARRVCYSHELMYAIKEEAASALVP